MSFPTNKCKQKLVPLVLARAANWLRLWLQGCSSIQEAQQRSTSTRRALQHHMEFDAEKATDVDYRSGSCLTESALPLLVGPMHSPQTHPKPSKPGSV